MSCIVPWNKKSGHLCCHIKVMLINYKSSTCGKEMVDKYCTLDNQLMDHSQLPLLMHKQDHT